MSEHLTERQKRWMASLRAGLERDTGKTLDEWVAIARTCPETKMRKREKWLKDNYGLGVNRASVIFTQAFGSDYGWDNPDAQGLGRHAQLQAAGRDATRQRLTHEIHVTDEQKTCQV